MNYNFKISKAMDTYKVSKLGIPENLLLRVPLNLRQEHHILPGSTPVFITADGKLISLIVTHSRKEDINDQECVYITSEVAKILGVENGGIKEVILYEGITLGCDPEFFIVNSKTGNIQTATSFFSKWASVGSDGIMAEIRPLPSIDANVVAANIYNLLCEAREKVNKHYSGIGPDLIFIGMSTYNNVQAGFHLHYGIPLSMLGPLVNGTPKQKMINLMVKAMDFYIGIPSVMPEGESDSMRRTLPFLSYGKPGEYRIDTHTLEYRVPGGSLLKHPILTKGILALGAVVVEDLVSRIEKCTDSFSNMSEITTNEDLHILYPNIPDIQEIIQSICSVRLDKARSHLGIIKNDIEKMVGYKRRAEVVDEFFKYIMEPTTIPFSSNIEENWRKYYNASKPRQMAFYQ